MEKVSNGRYILNRFLPVLCNNRRTTGFVTRRVQHVEQKLLTLPQHPSSPSFFCGVRVDRSLVFGVVLCISLFSLLSFFCWPLHCLSVVNLRLPITPLVSSDYPFGIFWLPLWYLLITPLVSSDYSIGIFWLPLWYLQIFLSN